MNKRGTKRGQVTIFIIIALMIIVFAALIFFFYPKIQAMFISEPVNPSAYIENCLGPDISQTAETVALQGGSIRPEHYILYEQNKVEYLCYSEEYYKQCVVQQPMLKNHIEEEIKNQIKSKVDACFDEMKDNFERQGYTVSIKKGETELELLPKKILLTSDTSLVLKKGDDSTPYKSINVAINNNLYELVSIANSIISWETKYGDAETTIYMNYYPYLKVEKYKQTDGTTVYIITDRNTNDKLQFASRSVAWPPGYGTESMLYENE